MWTTVVHTRFCHEKVAEGLDLPCCAHVLMLAGVSLSRTVQGRHVSACCEPRARAHEFQHQSAHGSLTLDGM